MKKKFFFTLSRPLRRLMVTISSLGIISLFLMNGGCGKKNYIPPDKEVKSHIILINEIYAPGFYVEVDGGDAGFLQKELDIRVKPGDHKLKVFNNETSLSLLKEMQETTTHQFDLKVKVSEGEAKEIVLSWEDKGYSKEVRKGLRPTEKEKKGRKGRNKDQAPRLECLINL
jgi:hypothetical protein